MRKSVNYGRKKFYSTGPSTFCKMISYAEKFLTHNCSKKQTIQTGSLRTWASLMEPALHLISAVKNGLLKTARRRPLSYALQVYI